MGSWSHTQIWISKVTEISDVCWSTIITCSHVFVIHFSLTEDRISVGCHVVNLRFDVLYCEMVKLGMQIACSVDIILYWWWEYEFEFERFDYGKIQFAGARVLVSIWAEWCGDLGHVVLSKKYWSRVCVKRINSVSHDWGKRPCELLPTLTNEML